MVIHALSILLDIFAAGVGVLLDLLLALAFIALALVLLSKLGPYLPWANK